LKKELLQGKLYLPNDRPYPMMDEMTILHDENGFYIDSREYVSFQLERIAKNIKNMVIPTIEEWEKVKEDFKCPKCGKHYGIHVD
jgi:rhodanese-related sulfurtransferase